MTSLKERVAIFKARRVIKKGKITVQKAVEFGVVQEGSKEYWLNHPDFQEQVNNIYQQLGSLTLEEAKPVVAKLVRGNRQKSAALITSMSMLIEKDIEDIEK